MTRESSLRRLLVEGPDDQWSVINLMRRHGANWDDLTVPLPHVHACGGFDPLLKAVPVAVTANERLGIMVDANSDLPRRWIEVKTALNSAGVQLSDDPDVNGIVVSGMYPDWRIGVWLMPDNQNQGRLEDFLAKLVPPNDGCWTHACDATRRAKEIGAAFAEQDQIKASVHTWLAWQEVSGLPFGTAITAKYFSADSPEALRFVEWFKRLFS